MLTVLGCAQSNCMQVVSKVSQNDLNNRIVHVAYLGKIMRVRKPPDGSQTDQGIEIIHSHSNQHPWSALTD